MRAADGEIAGDLTSVGPAMVSLTPADLADGALRYSHAQRPPAHRVAPPASFVHGSPSGTVKMLRTSRTPFPHVVCEQLVSALA